MVLAFDQQHELLWAGAGSGMIYTLQSPSLEPFACWRAHGGCVQDLVPHSEGAALSVASDALALHTAGGVMRMRVPQKPKRGAGDATPDSTPDVRLCFSYFVCLVAAGLPACRPLQCLLLQMLL